MYDACINKNSAGGALYAHVVTFCMDLRVINLDKDLMQNAILMFLIITVIHLCMCKDTKVIDWIRFIYF